jgi:hypothetical protein
MSTSANAKIQIETGQTLTDYAEATDSGDQQYFTIGTLLSGKSGFAPIVRPNGIISGRNLITPGATNDIINIAAFTAYSKSEEQEVSATAATCTRATTTGYKKINSITMASDGSILVVEGTQTSTSFSEVRAATGGPPLIPVTSVEIGQIRMTAASDAAAEISTDEIFQNVGDHTERYDYPVWDGNNLGEGEAADVAAAKNSHIKFASAMDLDHTGPTAKQVWVKYYTPILSEVSRALNFKPVENTHSVTSQEYYRGTIGSTSSSIGQGGFTALLNDGLTDAIVAEKDQILTVKFFGDENKSAYSLTQGKIGLARTFPEASQNQAEVTISAEKVTAEFAS